MVKKNIFLLIGIGGSNCSNSHFQWLESNVSISPNGKKKNSIESTIEINDYQFMIF